MDVKGFLKRKNIVISAKRYGVDALGAMAQGLFCSLLIGTIIKTLGQQLNVAFLAEMGGFASAMSAPAMAIAIGYALQAPPLVLFSLAAVGQAANALGGAGGPLADICNIVPSQPAFEGILALSHKNTGTALKDAGILAVHCMVWFAWYLLISRRHKHNE